MPGRGSYGPGGKWIHDRAQHILAKGDLEDRHGQGEAKRVAYAIASQQAHRLGTAPKKGAGPRGMYGTPEGKATAMKKYDAPKSQYVKTPAPKSEKRAMDLRVLRKLANLEPLDPQTGLSTMTPKPTISAKPKNYTRTNFASTPSVSSTDSMAKSLPTPKV